MKKLVSFIFLLALNQWAPASQPRGAWLEEGVKWTKVRPDINPELQWAEVRIIFFGKQKTFGLIYCTVNRVPGRMTISPGDPRGVYKGDWRVDGSRIITKYRLVEATLPQRGQKLPGPFESRIIQMSRGAALTLDGKTFRRAPALDTAAAEALK
jgi:hypothetical protein